MALQSDKVKEWGGVDKESDLVHYIPTTTGADGKIVWGGLAGGAIAGQHGIPVHAIRAEARFDVPGGKYGAIESMLG